MRHRPGSSQLSVRQLHPDANSSYHKDADGNEHTAIVRLGDFFDPVLSSAFAVLVMRLGCHVDRTDGWGGKVGSRCR
jgi:hypothetical protein